MSGALEDVRVIDLGTVIAQPFNTGLLADLGAEVIKVVDPATAQQTAMFAQIQRVRNPGLIPMGTYRDRSKESISLNLRNPKAVEVLKELIKNSDVVIENFSPGTMDRMGVGYEVLKAVNPRIIYGAVSAFGQTGPYSHHRGYDILAQARTGYGSVTGFPHNPPTRSGNSITDYYAGMLCGFSVLAALRHRDRTGEGQSIDIALFEALFMQLEGYVERTKNDGEQISRQGNESLTHGPACAVYESQDGWIAIDAHRDEWWAGLSRAMNQPALASEPRLSTYAARRDNPDLVRTTLASWAAGRPADDAEQVLLAEGVPAARVLTVAEMVERPQVKSRGVYATVIHPEAGRATITGTPFGGLSETPGKVYGAPPPTNQHYRPILKRVLAYTDQQIDELDAEGVFRT